MSNNDTFTAPTIIKRLEQTELNEVSKLIADCHVLPVKIIRAFLAKRNRNESQIENIINQLVKRKLAFYDETKTLLKLNRAYSSSDISQGYVKSIWLLLDLINNIDEYFIQNKAPHTLTFFNSNAMNEGINPVYDVFYIPYGSEKINEYIVNNMPVYSEEPLNCFVIVEAEEQVNMLKFCEKINVVSYAIISADGEVNYIDVSE